MIVGSSISHFFQLLPITWQTFSTIGTLFAVIVAIFLPSWRDRRRLRLQLRIGQVVDIPFPPNIAATGPADQLVYTSENPNDPNIRLKFRGPLGEAGFIRVGESPYYPVVVALTVTNIGRFSVVIDGWEMQFKAQGKVESKVVFEQGVKPREVGARGKFLQLVSDGIVLQMPTLTEMWVTDTIGKKWRVSRSEIRKIRAFKASL